jgi:hypothetical protein
MQHPYGHMAGADVQDVSGAVKRTLHLGASGVAAGVHDASPRVATFAGQRPPAGSRFVETRSVTD